MSKPNPPAPPDYTGAAIAQGQANVDAAKVQGHINNPNVVGPYGTQTVTWGASQPLTAVQQGFFDKGIVPGDTPGTLKSIYGGPSVSPLEAAQYNNYSSPSDIQALMSYAQGASPNQPTITQQLSPEQQNILNQSQANQLQLGGLAKQGIGAAQGIIGAPVNYTGLPQAAPDYNTLISQQINAAMQRPTEDYQRAVAQKNSDLVAAGIRPGSTAYDTQMNLLNRGLNDARAQAVLSGSTLAQQAFQTDTQRRQQALSEMLAQRSVPLNEITALMSGSQVSNPFSTPGYAQNSQVNPAPLFAAQNALAGYNTDVYNTKAAQQGNLTSGLPHASRPAGRTGAPAAGSPIL